MELENENTCYCCFHVQKSMITVAIVLSATLLVHSIYIADFAEWNVNLILGVIIDALLLPTTATAVVTAITKSTLIAKPFVYLCVCVVYPSELL
ncbi:hypothetical protein AB6A40_007546 [Gnathostoma spinigerum]|uniref:Uncharacterized protein n=1 Tax=Gnathostoma spinigerum TaxID=75299 RepID=A0ABD6EVX6_9BILA